MKPNTDFIEATSYDADDEWPSHPKNTEVAREYPQSTLYEGDCPRTECGFRGTYLVFGWQNTYWRCPDCGYVMIAN